MDNGWHAIRKAYEDDPIDNGDALVVIPELELVQQVDGLADRWDPTVRTSVARLLRGLAVTEVLLAVARPGAELLPQDHAMWADLREQLLGSGITVLPPEGLPSAA